MQNQQPNTSFQEAQPLVSFIIAYYNLPVQMLCECIDSILALSLQPSEREIIIVDDGSKVSPMNGLMRYGDAIIYIRQKNQGLSCARNKGIDMATGKYLQFVDADDKLITASYNYCIQLLREHEDADMVMFDFTNDETQQQMFSLLYTTNGTELMRHHNIHGTACGYIFRKNNLSELRFTPGIYHEDEEFTPLLLIRAELLLVTDAKAYYYNKRRYSITTSTDKEKTQKRLNDCHSVIVRLHNKADRLPVNERLAIQRRVAQLTMDYLYQVIMQTRSSQELNQRIKQLRSQGLFPLPRRNYSQKYVWFRVMTITSFGRTILLNTLPLISKER